VICVKALQSKASKSTDQQYHFSRARCTIRALPILAWMAWSSFGESVDCASSTG
jgi:hypothetical protein